MFRFCIAFAVTLLYAGMAMCQKPDTVFYYKSPSGLTPYRVNPTDDYDYIRVILPPDSGDQQQLVNIKDFYKNGALKLAGKSLNKFNPRLSGIVVLEGPIISFFPNGKRESIITYKENHKTGDGYFYYPTGKLYNIYKYVDDVIRGDIYWTCYDINGNEICKDGNGYWTTYDRDFKNIELQGAVKNGHCEGEWVGMAKVIDSIRCVFIYKKGILTSSTSYDKSGIAHTFKAQIEDASYPGGIFVFVDNLKRYLKLPKDENGKKVNIDSLEISFVIEKNGVADQLKVTGNPDPLLTNAFEVALSKSQGWSAGKFFGITLGTEITFRKGWIVTTEQSNNHRMLSTDQHFLIPN